MEGEKRRGGENGGWGEGGTGGSERRRKVGRKLCVASLFNCAAPRTGKSAARVDSPNPSAPCSAASTAACSSAASPVHTGGVESCVAAAAAEPVAASTVSSGGTPSVGTAQVVIGVVGGAKELPRRGHANSTC